MLICMYVNAHRLLYLSLNKYTLLLHRHALPLKANQLISQPSPANFEIQDECKMAYIEVLLHPHLECDSL